MIARTLALLILLTTPALAQTASLSATPPAGTDPTPRAAPSAPQGPQASIVRGLCQRDGCDEFAVVDVQTLKAYPGGTLKRTHLKTYHSSSAGREERQDETGYVYCSPTRPAVIAERGGKAMAFYLAPFATEESRETARKYTNFVATYFAICHGPELGREAVRDLAGTASRLGYQADAPASVVAAIKRPEDVVGPAPALAARPAIAPQRDLDDADREDSIPRYAARPLPPREIEDDRIYADAPGYRYPSRRLTDELAPMPPGLIPED